MNREALVAATVADLIQTSGRHVPKTTAALLVDAVFRQIGGAMARGESVRVKDFAVFTLRSRQTREGKHPRTGVPIVITGRSLPAVRFSKKLKEQVADTVIVSALPLAS